MKKFLAVLGALVIMAGTLFAFSGSASASSYVHGYTRRNGSYVMPHYRTSPNSTRLDNWSTKGNYNPYTGSKGYRSPYSYYRGY